MEPTYRSGDLVVVRRQENYEVGDIVAYRIPRGEPGEGIIVIHRVVGGSSQEGLVTKGDNRQGPDLWRPTAADVVGKAWIHVPGGGRILAFLRSPLVVATLAGGLAFVLVLMAGRPQARTNSDRGPWAAGR
jgi:signal peptidase I